MRPKLYLISLLVLSFSCASLTSYLDKRPEVRIKNFDIKAISFRDIDLLFDIEITNPYPIGLKLEKVKFRVDIEKRKLFSTVTPKGFRIRPNGSATTPLTVNLEYRKIARIVRDYRRKEYLQCDISGEISIPLPKIPGLPKTFTFPFKLTKKIPAIRPTISISNFRVKAPSLASIKNAIRRSGKNLNAEKVVGLLGNLLRGRRVRPKDIGLADLDLKLDVNFDIKIKNNTRAKIFFKKLSYNFYINNENVFNGNTNKTRMIGNTLVLSVANQLSSKSLGKGVLRIFKRRRGVFKLKGQTFINLPPSIKRSPLKLSFDENGNFRL